MYTISHNSLPTVELLQIVVDEKQILASARSGWTRSNTIKPTETQASS
jgi:hypothetical protein